MPECFNATVVTEKAVMVSSGVEVDSSLKRPVWRPLLPKV